MKHNIIIEKRKIIVVAQIKGVNDFGSIKLILDTGASKTIIDEDVVRRLGFDLYRLRPGDRLMTAGGGVSSKILKLPQFSLFDKKLTNFEVNVFKIAPQITYYVDGLVGMDFLLKFNNIRFDFEAKTVETT